MSSKKQIAVSIIGVVASVALLVVTAILAEEVIISASLAVVLTIISVILVLVAISYAAKVDYKTGVYECRNCKNTFKPTFMSYFLGAHTLTTRGLKCPECGKTTWCKRRTIEKAE